MTQYNNTAEGLANGTVPTAANTGGGSGTAFDAVNIVSSSTIVADTTRAMHGTKSYKFTAGGSAIALMSWNISTKTLATRIWSYHTVIPTGGLWLDWVGVGTTRVAGIDLRPTGKVRVMDGASTAGVYTSTSNYPVNTWVRHELVYGVGTSTSNGRIRYAMYNGDSTTPIDTPYDSSALNLGTASLTRHNVGLNNNTSDTTPFWIDDPGHDDTATAFMGPIATNTLPTAVLTGGGISVEPGSTFTLSGLSSSDADGTIASHAYTQTAGTTTALTGSGTANRTGIAPYTLAGTTLTYQLNVTDNQGGVSTNNPTASIVVYPAASHLKSGGVIRPNMRRQYTA